MRIGRLIIALLATAAIVLPAVSAAAGGGREAGVPAASSDAGKRKGSAKKTPAKSLSAAKRLAALRVEAEALARRVAALKAGGSDPVVAPDPTPSPAGPAPHRQQSIEAASGPAGGDLAGAFPAPRLAPRSVGATAIGDDAVGTAQLAPGTLAGKDFAPGSIGSADVANTSLSPTQVAPGAFGAVQLDETFRWPPAIRGPNVSLTLAPGQHGRVAVACPNGTRLLSGGYFWKNLDGRRAEILNSSPGPGAEAANVWEVVAKVQSGGTENTITPVALCLE